MTQLLYAFLGSVGFSLIFNVRGRHILPAALGGLLAQAVFRLCAVRMGGVFFPALTAGAVAAVYAHLMARVHKAPTTLYLIIAVIPLIPGASLYRTVRAAVDGNIRSAYTLATQTAGYALGIAAGMSLYWVLNDTMSGIAKRRTRRNNKEA